METSTGLTKSQQRHNLEVATLQSLWPARYEEETAKSVALVNLCGDSAFKEYLDKTTRGDDHQLVIFLAEIFDFINEITRKEHA